MTHNFLMQCLQEHRKFLFSLNICFIMIHGLIYGSGDLETKTALMNNLLSVTDTGGATERAGWKPKGTACSGPKPSCAECVTASSADVYSPLWKSEPRVPLRKTLLGF